MINPDAAHFRRLNAYANRMKSLYDEALREFVKLSSLVKGFDSTKPFSFDDYPQTRQRANKVIQGLITRQTALIRAATEKEWMAANAKTDVFVDSVLKGSSLSAEQVSRYYSRNIEGLEAFRGRKEAGLALSDRVWRHTQQFKSEMELALDIGLGEGKSAAALSRDVRRLLNEPDRLFRRVRDKHGNLVLSKAAKAYHPGRGVYRSSYKNAMRLTRTEVNMAYRTADHERWQQLDFVVGFEVRLSNNPKRISDICDDLKGRYPKDFKFRGWHPQCMCHVVSIMATDSEFDRMEDQILNGDPVSVDSVNAVKDVPAGFKGWLKDNEERIEGWKSRPYFMRDNPGYL
ncbi:MAG TPA: hypothetical protein P5531_03960 [Bacteroidales bacterium]|nr:hypothetical protein [Bacteroidales bacterium]